LFIHTLIAARGQWPHLCAIALVWLFLQPAARAVTPAPDGGYDYENTAEGTNALNDLIGGSGNTAIGFESLFHTNNSGNTAVGYRALHFTAAGGDTAVGYNALANTDAGDNTAVGYSALTSDTSGTSNTGLGHTTLFSNTTGIGNTAAGTQALYYNVNGSRNTAMGLDALEQNISGSDNTAVGIWALTFNNTGYNNTAAGGHALHGNSTGHDNTAVGIWALGEGNNTGYNNTATGGNALRGNGTGFSNTADGSSALYWNRDGHDNTAQGLKALYSNINGNRNTASGLSSLLSNSSGQNNTATGWKALAGNTTGGGNIALGYQAGLNLTNGSNNIDIGAPGVAGEANTIRLGTVGTQQAVFVAGVSGATVPGGVTVVVDADGHLGTVTSSARFKQEIKPMEDASEALLALKPVTFKYKHELDPAGIPQFGLVAEEVEKVNPNLVARDEEGKVYTVRYEAVNAMLLNEFLKEHQKVGELEAAMSRLASTAATQATVAAQQKEINALIATVKEQAAAMQKVDAELRLSKPAPQVANNDR
jgi:hypothetical protein